MAKDKTELHTFSNFVTKKTFENPALYQAWKDYESFVPTADFSDASVASTHYDGMTVDEVNKNFKSQVQSEHFAFESREESLKYIYQSEETMPESDNHYVATIYFHFLERRLFYSEIRIQTDTDLEKNFISEHQKREWIEHRASIEELEAAQPQTFGLAQMKMQGEMSYELFIPYVDEEGVEHAEFFMIRENRIRLGYSSTLAKEFQSNQNNLLRNLVAFDQYLRREQTDTQLEDSITHLTHPFDSFITANTMENPASRMAYQYYKTLYHNHPLADFNLKELKGQRIEDIQNSFNGQHDPVHMETSDREEYLIYLFESEKINPSTGKKRQAELKLYFYDGIFTYADVFGLDSYFFESELLSFKEMIKELPKGTALEKFIEYEPITMGFAEFKYENKNYRIILTPQMEDSKMKIVNYVFIDEVMEYAFATDYSDIKDSIRNAMTQTFMNLTKSEF